MEPKKELAKYKRVTPSREKSDAPRAPNEVRITQEGPVWRYVSVASNMVKDDEQVSVVLSGMGRAIQKTVTVAEVLKHRIVGLHQVTRISSKETTERYEPLEEGLDAVEKTRFIPCISIELSIKELDTSDPGYQSPLPETAVQRHKPRGERTKENADKSEQVASEENKAPNERKSRKTRRSKKKSSEKATKNATDKD